MLSGNKQLPELIWTQSYVTIWRHWATMLKYFNSSLASNFLLLGKPHSAVCWKKAKYDPWIFFSYLNLSISILRVDVIFA